MIEALERSAQPRNGCDAPSLNGSVAQELRNAGLGLAWLKVWAAYRLSKPDMAFCTQGWNVRTARRRPLRMFDIGRSNAGHKSQPVPSGTVTVSDCDDGGTPRLYYNQINIFGLAPQSWKPKAPDSQF